MQSFISKMINNGSQCMVFFFDNEYLQSLYNEGRNNNNKLLILDVGWEGWAYLTRDGYKHIFGNHNYLK